jgi:flagellar basal-body rod protein FlgF
MGNKGIYTALSGAVAQNQRLDTIANNIANVNTTGFKKDRQVFKEYLTAAEKAPDVIQVPKIPASIESFYDLQSADKGYVDASGTYTDHTQGNVRTTSNPFDLAIEGQGFFEVLTPRGVRYTRNGGFKISPQGQLVTRQGYPVLRQGQGEPATRTFALSDRNLTVSYNGNIFQGEEQLGQLSVMTIADADALRKEGESLYSVKPNYNMQMVPSPDAQVHQGFLEASNVNIVDEMTKMIKTSRNFESLQKAIKAFDSMNGKLINEVGKV